MSDKTLDALLKMLSEKGIDTSSNAEIEKTVRETLGKDEMSVLDGLLNNPQAAKEFLASEQVKKILGEI